MSFTYICTLLMPSFITSVLLFQVTSIGGEVGSFLGSLHGSVSSVNAGEYKRQQVQLKSKKRKKTPAISDTSIACVLYKTSTKHIALSFNSMLWNGKDREERLAVLNVSIITVECYSFR